MTGQEKSPSPGGLPRVAKGKLVVPDQPELVYIEGDGIGIDITPATLKVLDAAVERAYRGVRRIRWREALAGEKAYKKTGEWLPEATLEAIRSHRVALKGPLTTPVGGGIRSLNVALRQVLDLYACIRPVRYFDGVPSPLADPRSVDLVLFRENTEDVYAGIEWKSGSPEARRVIEFLRDQMGVRILESSGVGIKPMSPENTKRLVRAAIRYALERGRRSVTLVHKGNIMKFTEGAFRDWGYELARDEFGAETISEAELKEPSDAHGRLVIKDRIADAMFQQLLLRPADYDVLATPNLNGDYLSDAAIAQVGGLGLAPGANVGDEAAVFEATHGTAPKYAGQDKANPGSLILSGVMLLEHIGWHEAARAVTAGLATSIRQKTVTYDLERQMEGAELLSCSEFGQAIIDNMPKREEL